MNVSCRSMVGGLAVSLVFLAGNASAADREWKGADYNDDIYNLGDPLHWDGGVPDNTDVAIFTGTGANAIPGDSVFTVQLPGNATVSTFHARDGQFNLTLDLNGYTFATQDTSNDGIAYIQGPGSGVIVNLVGGGATWTNFRMGFDADTTGTLNINNPTALSIVGASTANIGGSGAGTLNMSGGATLTSTRNMVLSSSSTGTGTGTWTMSGSATSAAVSNHVWIGDYGAAELLIENGAQLTNSGGSNYIIFGHRGGAGQVVNALITGEGSLVRANPTTATRGITIGGGELGTATLTAGTVHVTVADQARIESNRLILLHGAGKLTVDNGTAAAATHLVASDNSALAFVIYNANRDALIQAGGDVTIGADVELALSLGTGASFAVGEFVELIEFGGLQTGTFKDFTEGHEFGLQVPGNGTEYEFRFTYAGGVGDDTIGLEVIPEPGSLALILLGLGALAVRRRFV